MSLESRDQMQRAVSKAQAEINAQSQQALFERINEVCIKRCLPARPADKLSDSSRRCLDACASSFKESFQVAGETLASILKREAGGAGGSGGGGGGGD